MKATKKLVYLARFPLAVYLFFLYLNYGVPAMLGNLHPTDRLMPSLWFCLGAGALLALFDDRFVD